MEGKNNCSFNVKDYEDVVMYEDFADDSAADLTFLGEDGNLVNLSDYEVVALYDFEACNGTEGLDSSSSIPRGRLVAVSLFVVLFFVGIIGNALVISTVVRFGNLRKVTYLYLVNLAVADLLYLLVCLPTLTASYALIQWPFGQFFCRLDNYLVSVSMSVSVLTIMVTSLDRFLAILYPVKSRPLRTTKTALTVIAAVWVASFTLLTARVPLFDLESKFHSAGGTLLCVRVGSHRELLADTTLVFVFLYLLPQIVLAVCHFGIGRKLWYSERPGTRQGIVTQGNIFGIRERRRIAKIMIVITIVFGVGWLPVHLYHLVEDFDSGNILFGDVLDRGAVALFFSFGANSLNPFFYCVFSGTFRKRFKQALLCRRKTLVGSLENKLPRRVEEGCCVQPRPPIVLLPRPASIIPSLPGQREETPLQLRPLLGGEDPASRLRNNDSTPAASPLSVEELTGIRVSDSDLTTGGAFPTGIPHTLKASLSSLYTQELIPMGRANANSTEVAEVTAKPEKTMSSLRAKSSTFSPSSQPKHSNITKKTYKTEEREFNAKENEEINENQRQRGTTDECLGAQREHIYFPVKKQWSDISTDNNNLSKSDVYRPFSRNSKTHDAAKDCLPRESTLRVAQRRLAADKQPVTSDQESTETRLYPSSRSILKRNAQRMERQLSAERFQKLSEITNTVASPCGLHKTPTRTVVVSATSRAITTTTTTTCPVSHENFIKDDSRTVTPMKNCDSVKVIDGIDPAFCQRTSCVGQTVSSNGCRAKDKASKAISHGCRAKDKASKASCQPHQAQTVHTSHYQGPQLSPVNEVTPASKSISFRMPEVE